MIDIKEFNVGDTVYIDRDYKKDTLNKAIVIKVGRKYVTVMEHGWKTQYSAEEYCPYALIEKTEIGSPSLLFKTEKSYSDYIELQQLEIWLRKEFGGYSNTKYTLEQLRNVKAILEGRDVYHTFPVPPCKVGDTVYIIDNRDMLDIYPSVCSVVEDEIYEMGYGRTQSGELKWLFLVIESGEDFYDDEVGKTVFLTKDEAEKALAERSKQ